MTLQVNDAIEMLSTNSAYQLEQILVFRRFFVPNMYAMNKWMSLKKRLITGTYEHADLSIRKMLVQMFCHCSSENNITDEGCLYDEKFFHLLSLSRYIEIAQSIVE